MKMITAIYLMIMLICFSLTGCNDKEKETENFTTSTDATPVDAYSEESKTTEKEVAKDKTTATTTETSKPQTTQTPATTQATTEAPKPQTTQAPVTTQATTEAPKPQTTQAPATTQANKPQTTQAPVTTQAPAKTEHQHSWESVGHTETHDYRTDTGADVTGQQISIVNGQRCVITGYTGGYECGVCGYRCTTGQEIDDHVWGVHNGEANTKDWQEPIYVSVTQKSVYVEDYQRCSICGATK